ncbi:MAG: hypothetical protein ACRC33_11140 [Gemmataceae bacterium]
MNAGRLFLIAVTALTPPAPAGTLDDALLGEGPRLVEKLWRRDVRTVGVLPFQLKRGPDAGYGLAPLCAALPARLENVLTLVQDPRLKAPLRVVRVSPAQRRGWSAGRDAFDRLFAADAEAVWGAGAKPDGLLTGTITPSADRKTVEIAFELLKAGAWDGGKPAPVALTTLTVEADRPLVRELGGNVAARALVVRRPKPEEAVEEVATTPDDIAGMKVEIEYDGKKQAVRRSDGAQLEYAVAAPRPGQKVVLYLQRVGKEAPTLGVVVKVGGKSLFEAQDVESLSARKWLYPVTKRIREEFAGIYTKTGDRLTCQPFEAAEVPDDNIARLGARATWIDIDVFVSRPKDEVVADGELLISTRGVGKKGHATLAAARDGLAAANGLKLPPLPAKPPEEYEAAFKSVVKERGVVIGVGKPLPTTEAVRTGKFPNPARVGGLSIRLESANSTKEIDD